MGWLVSKMAGSTIPSSLAGAVPVAKTYTPMRLHQILRRFGTVPHDPVATTSSPSSSRLHSRDADGDSFYSASDPEDIDEDDDLEEGTPLKRLSAVDASASATGSAKYFLPRFLRRL